jgi:hypothetical protein
MASRADFQSTSRDYAAILPNTSVHRQNDSSLNVSSYLGSQPLGIIATPLQTSETFKFSRETFHQRRNNILSMPEPPKNTTLPLKVQLQQRVEEQRILQQLQLQQQQQQQQPIQIQSIGVTSISSSISILSLSPSEYSTSSSSRTNSLKQKEKVEKEKEKEKEKGKEVTTRERSLQELLSSRSLSRHDSWSYQGTIEERDGNEEDEDEGDEIFDDDSLRSSQATTVDSRGYTNDIPADGESEGKEGKGYDGLGDNDDDDDEGDEHYPSYNHSLDDPLAQQQPQQISSSSSSSFASLASTPSSSSFSLSSQVPIIPSQTLSTSQNLPSSGIDFSARARGLLNSAPSHSPFVVPSSSSSSSVPVPIPYDAGIDTSEGEEYLTSSSSTICSLPAPEEPVRTPTVRNTSIPRLLAASKKPSGTSTSNIEMDDWNGRFQRIISHLPARLDSSAMKKEADERQRWLQHLILLTRDFLHAATLYGRIIISEKHLPDHLKTISPCIDVGGRAGGTKYRVHNIMFSK